MYKTEEIKPYRIQGHHLDPCGPSWLSQQISLLRSDGRHEFHQFQISTPNLDRKMDIRYRRAPPWSKSSPSTWSCFWDRLLGNGNTRRFLEWHRFDLYNLGSVVGRDPGEELQSFDAAHPGEHRGIALCITDFTNFLYPTDVYILWNFTTIEERVSGSSQLVASKLTYQI